MYVGICMFVCACMRMYMVYRNNVCICMYMYVQECICMYIPIDSAGAIAAFSPFCDNRCDISTLKMKLKLSSPSPNPTFRRSQSPPQSIAGRLPGDCDRSHVAETTVSLNFFMRGVEVKRGAIADVAIHSKKHTTFERLRRSGKLE